MLDIRNLTVHYGQALALSDISLRVGEGELVALIGPNGAGKTTLLRTISGLVRPTSGEVGFCGQPVHRLRPDAIVRLGISQCPEHRHLGPEMTVRDNLLMGAYLRRDTAQMTQDLDWVHRLFPRLQERAQQLAGTLSGGEQQMVAIGRALMSRPRMLLLDEPSLGLAPVVKQRIFASIKEISATGVTIVVVEQDARLALRISSRAYVIESGRIVMEQRSDELLSSDYVRRAYLGI